MSTDATSPMTNNNNNGTPNNGHKLTIPVVPGSWNRSWIDGTWFRELTSDWEGYGQSFEMEEILYHKESEFQDILVFRNKIFGTVLVLNGQLQLTERDEFTYQEMIAHIPMNLSKNPKKVLVIGGGDGGVVREVLKYSSVEEVVLCEIDQEVIDVCRKFLPSMSGHLDDPRVNIQVGDGKAYVESHQGEFDVVITDSPDPEGEAKGLYESDYYKNLKNVLREDGVACCQGEMPFLDIGFVTDMVSQCRTAFPCVGYAMGCVPTYLTGGTGYVVASPNKSLDLTKPVRELSQDDLARMQLRYYNSDTHRAAFSIPNYVRQAVKDFIDT